MRLISFTVNQTEVLMYLPEHLVHQLDQGGLLHQFDPEKIDEKNCETHIFWSSFTIKINSNQRDKQT